MKLNTVGLLELIQSHQRVTYKGADPSFRELARDMETSPSTFTRMRRSAPMSADTLIRMIDWLWARGNTPDQILRKIVAPAPMKPKPKARKSA